MELVPLSWLTCKQTVELCTDFLKPQHDISHHRRGTKKNSKVQQTFKGTGKVKKGNGVCGQAIREMWETTTKFLRSRTCKTKGAKKGSRKFKMFSGLAPVSSVAMIERWLVWSVNLAGWLYLDMYSPGSHGEGKNTHCYCSEFVKPVNLRRGNVNTEI